MAGASRQIWAFDCEWVPDLTAGRRLYHLGADVPDEEVLRVMWEQGGATDENSLENPENVHDVLLQATGASRVFVYETPALSVNILTLTKNRGRL